MNQGRSTPRACIHQAESMQTQFTAFNIWVMARACCNYIFIFISPKRQQLTVRKKYNKHRSTGTVHTSATVHLTSVTIQIQIYDPDHDQSLIICSVAHCQPSLKISCKSIWKFLREVADKQIKRQTNRWKNNDENIISLAHVMKQKHKCIHHNMHINKNTLKHADRQSKHTYQKG